MSKYEHIGRELEQLLYKNPLTAEELVRFRELLMEWRSGIGVGPREVSFDDALRLYRVANGMQPHIVTPVDYRLSLGKASVPRVAEYLVFLVLPKKDRESVQGDLEEEYYTTILPKFGSGKAKLWYWKQVVWSIWPIVSMQVRIILMRITVAAGIAKTIREMLRHF